MTVSASNRICSFLDFDALTINDRCCSDEARSRRSLQALVLTEGTFHGVMDYHILGEKRVILVIGLVLGVGTIPANVLCC